MGSKHFDETQLKWVCLKIWYSQLWWWIIIIPSPSCSTPHVFCSKWNLEIPFKNHASFTGSWIWTGEMKFQYDARCQGASPLPMYWRDCISSAGGYHDRWHWQLGKAPWLFQLVILSFLLFISMELICQQYDFVIGIIAVVYNWWFHFFFVMDVYPFSGSLPLPSCNLSHRYKTFFPLK